MNVTLANPLVVAHASAPVGLRVDFDLHKSIAVDNNGNITGTVTPTFNVENCDSAPTREATIDGSSSPALSA